MSHGLALIQQGLASLGYDPGQADGIDGPRTRKAIAEAHANGWKPKLAAAAIPSSGLVRIVMHWTAGGANVTALDRNHYHFIVGQDGAIVPGVFTPEDNISTRDERYAAHTANCNTGSIGVAVAGMMNATERPFDAGQAPITWPQIEAFTAMVARLCKQYGIPVTGKTVLTHAEVQPVLGIAQRGKIDIRWLPGMTSMPPPVEVGDKLRAMVAAKI